jgi:hypothetical protein
MWAGKLGPSSERGGKAARWREGWLDVVRGEVLPAGLLGGVFQPRSRLQRLSPSSLHRICCTLSGFTHTVMPNTISDTVQKNKHLNKGILSSKS